MQDMIERLEAMLARGQDNMLLRYTLGKSHAEQGRYDLACDHLRAALAFDERYTVAWKWLGKALLGLGRQDEARQAWERGLDCARQRGDQQVLRELQVFLKRLDKSGR